MRVLVCGARGFNDRKLLTQVLHSLTPAPTTIIQDGETVAAELSGRWTRENGLVLETYSADWKNSGVLAGRIRNQRMLDEGKPELIVAFAANRETNHLTVRARAMGIKVVEVAHHEPVEDARKGAA